MITYQSTLQDSPPASEQQRSAALSGLRIKSPYGAYGSSHQDVLNALGDRNAAEYDQAAYRANMDYQMKQQDSQRQLALAGLQQMNEAQQNDNSLINQRFGNYASLLGGLLR